MGIISHGINLTSNNQPNSDQNQIIAELQNFELGRFLLSNHGLNGYWTNYILQYPEQGHLTGLSSDGSKLSKMETWILSQCPILLATQERYQQFRRITQQLLRSNMHLASVPCGLMQDLLSLDYQAFDNIQLSGLDLDPDSLAHADQLSQSAPANLTINFACVDAWQIPGNTEWDLISSNGLNIYVPEDARCIELYQQFANKLKTGGYLITSFITPPQCWQPHNLADLTQQNLILNQGIAAKWQSFRSEKEIKRQLETAGFEILELIPDQQNMFPTVLARKI